MKNKVLIAGGAGFVGSHLCQNFKNANCDVYVFDNNIQYFYPMTKYSIKNMEFRHKFLLENTELIRGNTLDINDLRRTIIKVKPDFIINLAALPLAVTAVQKSEEAFSSILETTKNFFEIIRDCNFIKKYVHISSSMIYGDFVKTPNPESATKNPKEIYGSLKLASEYVVNGYSKRYDINSTIIRPSAVYGPTDNNYRVIQKFIENILNKKKISVNNPKSNYLDFTYVEDLVEGIKLATLQNTENLDVFNLTRGEGRSLYELLMILEKKIGKFDYEINEQQGIYPIRGALDISNAKKKIGYKPKYSLEKGIDKYLDFFNNI